MNHIGNRNNQKHWRNMTSLGLSILIATLPLSTQGGDNPTSNQGKFTQEHDKSEHNHDDPSSKAKLGQLLFFDTTLSSPTGQACASCHAPGIAFTDPDNNIPTSAGATPWLKGNRNSPTAMYNAFTPKFSCTTERDKDSHCQGGLFLDGRATDLEEQAKGPFLNPLEMANPDRETVVKKIKKAYYASLFQSVYGENAFANTNEAYNNIADAIATFERTSVFQPFSSKYDYYLAGKINLTEQEKRGLKLFEDPHKGNCAACHPSRSTQYGKPPLFTDFTYDNLGVPKNPDNPFYQLSQRYNPAGHHFVDLGLGGVTHNPYQNGQFKVPTLRNIAMTAPYTHNGYFKTLRGIVEFYNNRDVKQVCKNDWVTDTNALTYNCWPTPEVRTTMNTEELGNLNLNDQEIDDIVTFLKTLTDQRNRKALTKRNR